MSAISGIGLSERHGARRSAPVRDVRGKASSGHTTGVVPMPGGDAEELLPEGRLDFDLQIIMSVAPWVREYLAQPERFDLMIDRKRVRYTPDGLVLGFGRMAPVWIEAKPLARLARAPDLGGRLDAIRRECAGRGGSFAILTEKQIRVQPRFGNSRRVYSAALRARAEEIERAVQALTGTHFRTLSEAAARIGEDGVRLAQALVGRRYLAADLVSVPLSLKSPVRPGPLFSGWETTGAAHA